MSYILFLHQTTTSFYDSPDYNVLSYILFLHQTTTDTASAKYSLLLSYILFLHQTTTYANDKVVMVGCLISCFYIKPQLPMIFSSIVVVVLYLVSTSNHNYAVVFESESNVVLYLVSTSNHNLASTKCIL